MSARFVKSWKIKRGDPNPDTFSRLLKAEEIPKYLAGSHTLNEYFACPDRDPNQAQLTKVYLDRDLYLGTEAPSSELILHHEQLVSDMLDEIAVELAQPGDDGMCPRFVATRHGYCPKNGKFKLSFRPFFQGVCIKYTDIPHLIRKLGQESFWDMSVYKASEQLLSTIMGHKSDDDQRVLTPSNKPGEGSLLAYIAQHVLPSWPIHTVDFRATTWAATATSTTRTVAIPETCADASDVTVDPHFVRALVKCLGKSTSNDRAAWVRMGIALKNIGSSMGDPGMFYEDWDTFSQLSPKYEDSGMEKVWNGLARLRVKTSGMGSLCRRAKMDNPAMYMAAQKARQVQQVAISSPIDDEKRSSFVSSLISRWPIYFHGVNEQACKLTITASQLMFEMPHPMGASKITGRMTDSYVVYLNVAGKESYLGLLYADIPINGQLSQLHKSILPDVRFTYNQQSESQGALTSTVPGTDIAVYDANKGSCVMMVNVHGKKVTVDNRKKVMAVKKIVDASTLAHVSAQLGYTSGSMFINVVNNGTINVYNSSDPDSTTSEFAHVRIQLLEFAAEKKLRKVDGYIFEPVEDCPCAYVQRCSYAEYINQVLREDEVYNNNPKRFDEALRYLQNYDVPKLPTLVRDRDLISFANGVLELTAGVFTPYSEITPATTEKTARHHIPQTYTGCSDTPLLDQVLSAQFEHDVAEVLCGMLGRLLFKVGQLDAWQVMPYLVGVGGTGKSLILTIVQHMFSPTAVGNLAAKREEIFGNANLVSKEIVIGRDMPAKLSGSLPQEIMQSMVSGESMEINRKNNTSLNVVAWTAAMLLASNHLPDYINTGGNIARRILSFWMYNMVKCPQEGLLNAILTTELPNIMCRFLRAYSDLRVKVREAGCFWKAMPPILLVWQKGLASATNKLWQFLEMDDDERGCRVECVEGRITWVQDFVAVYERKMGCQFVADPAVLCNFGFTYSEKRENICKSCRQLAKSRGGKCCEEYDNKNRASKQVIMNMRLVLD